MEKLIITACICGAEVTKEQNPAVPYTIEEIVREAKSAFDTYRKTHEKVGNLTELSAFMNQFKPFQSLSERLVSMYEFEKCRKKLENKKIWISK